NDMAILLIRQGDLERGEAFLLSSIQRFEEAGLQRRRSRALLSLAELRQGQGRLDEAALIIQDAIALAGGLDESQARGGGYRQLGVLQAASGERIAATASFQRALDIMRAAGLEQPYAECLAARARALGETGVSRASGTIA